MRRKFLIVACILTAVIAVSADDMTVSQAAADEAIEAAADVPDELAEVDSIEDAWGFFDRLFNDIGDWFQAERHNLLLMAGGFLLTLLIAWIASLFIRKILISLFARRTATDLDDLLLEKTRTPFMTLIVLTGFSASIHFLRLPQGPSIWLPKLFYAGFVLAILWGISRAISVLDLHYRRRARNIDHNMNEIMVNLIRRAAKVVVWTIAVLFLCQNVFNWNITALLTGAGIAGIAVAFAAQNTIANLFGAVSLISDKAFRIGDRIICSGSDGTVESVGLRSTKLRSLDGTLWDVPNRILADNTIENITGRKSIKYAFTLGLTYSTTPEQMERAIQILSGILDKHPAFNPEKNAPQYFFTTYSSSSLDISVTLWFQTTDFLQFQKWKQEINLEILRQFKDAGLEFAFPSVTNYLVSNQ